MSLEPPRTAANLNSQNMLMRLCAQPYSALPRITASTAEIKGRAKTLPSVVLLYQKGSILPFWYRLTILLI